MADDFGGADRAHRQASLEAFAPRVTGEKAGGDAFGSEARAKAGAGVRVGDSADLAIFGREGVAHGVAEGLGLKLGKVAQPLRVAVAFGPVSPPIDQTLALLGRETTLARIDRALAL